MQFNTLAIAFAIIGTSLAQDLSSVPQCAITPALAAFGKTGCNISNIKCICSSSSLIPDLEKAIAAACSASDLAKANAFAVSTCQKAGVTLNIPGYTASASGSSSGATDSSTASAGSASSTATAASVSSSASVSSAASASASTSASQTTSAGQTASSASTSPSPGAANTLQIGGSALFGVFLAALAL